MRFKIFPNYLCLLGKQSVRNILKNRLYPSYVNTVPTTIKIPQCNNRYTQILRDSILGTNWTMKNYTQSLVTIGVHYDKSWTAAMAGIFSRNFCVTATRTVMTPAAGPVIRTLTIGSSIPTSSRDPPAAPTR